MRFEVGQVVAEGLATFGLILVIVGGSRRVPLATPLVVAAWITGANLSINGGHYMGW